MNIEIHKKMLVKIEDRKNLINFGLQVIKK